MAAVDRKALVDKIAILPEPRVEEVADFVDFLLSRDGEQVMARALAEASEEAFGRVWNNPEDAAYDSL